MLELIKSGVWDRWMKRDYFRNYSNFCILDFLLILTLKYINYNSNCSAILIDILILLNTSPISSIFSLIHNWGIVIRRSIPLPSTDFESCVRLIEEEHEVKRDFSPYFFYINRIVQVDTNCSSTIRPPVILRSFTCY